MLWYICEWIAVHEMVVLSCVEHDTCVRKLAVHEEQLRFAGKMDTFSQINLQFPEDFFRNAMYREALMWQTKAVQALGNCELVEAMQFAESAVAEYKLVQCDYCVRKLDADRAIRKRFPSYMLCADLLLEVIQLKELGNTEDKLAEKASGEHDHMGADFHARQSISHYYAYEHKMEKLENEIDDFLVANMGRNEFVPTKFQRSSFVDMGGKFTPFECSAAINKRFEWFPQTKQANYRRLVLLCHQVLKDEYEKSMKTQGETMHRFVKEFSTAHDTQQTLARLTYERGDTYYHQAMRAMDNYDFVYARLCLKNSIYDFKLGSFDAWDKGQSVIELDERFQQSQRYLHAFNAYCAGNLAEDKARTAFVSGDLSNTMSYGLEAIEYYNRDHTGFYRYYERDLHRLQCFIDDMCARFDRFLDQVRPGLWLRGGTELRMLLQRHDPVRLQVPLDATQRLHAFLIPTGEDDEDDSENDDEDDGENDDEDDGENDDEDDGENDDEDDGENDDEDDGENDDEDDSEDSG